ncbi:hypothetical protein [Variovorax sp.]|uniref:hypothetical protein n=1 Tax=Variovorax sp. TaxID=1871043 RepID=UPI00403805AA
MGEILERTIRCSEANAAEFQVLVNGWSKLKALVRSLRALDLFPGLRCLQVTLAGARAWVDAGVLAAINPGGGDEDRP